MYCVSWSCRFTLSRQNAIPGPSFQLLMIRMKPHCHELLEQVTFLLQASLPLVSFAAGFFAAGFFAAILPLVSLLV